MDDRTPIAGDDRYLVQLEIFEGPLDLLLALIRKHELDIFDIPIAFVTRKYLEYLDLMAELNLNLASEYLEMAAQLTYIKSRTMLPTQEAEEEDGAPEDGPDPREELVRQLLEYQKYKIAAEDLARMPQMGRDTFPRGVEADLQAGDPDLVSPGLFALMEALQKVFARVEDAPGGSEISVTRLSVTARIHQVFDILRVRRRMPFLEIFEDHATRSDVVVTFLAILEMTRIGLSRLHQAAPGAEIYITAAADEEDLDKAIAGAILEDP